VLEILQPLHPKVSHFPIVLFGTAVVFDLLSLILRRESWHKTALQMYVFASLITPLVVRTGLWEEERLHLNHPVLETHRMFALWTMWAALMSLPVLWFIKREFNRYFRLTFLLILVVVVILVCLAGHNGGRMVFEYGVGMEQ